MIKAFIFLVIVGVVGIGIFSIYKNTKNLSKH